MLKNTNKVIALMLVIVMCFAYVAVIGNNYEVLADLISPEEAQEVVTKNGEVSFDAYLVSNSGSEEALKIGGENSLELTIKVEKDGYLTDGKITIENSNFKFGELDLSETIQSVSETEIVLNKIKSNDEEVQITVPIEFNKTKNAKVTDFSNINNVNFTGTFVNENGKEVEVSTVKEVKVMWTADANATISSELTKYVPFDLNGSRGVILQERITTGLEENNLPIGQETLTIQVPTINGASPTEVTVIGASSYNYNEQANTLIINNDRSVDSDGNIQWQEENDVFDVTYKYSEEALSDSQISTTLAGEVELKV